MPQQAGSQPILIDRNAGPLGQAQFRRERLTQDVDQINIDADVPGNSPSATTDAGRKDYAFYAETDIELLYLVDRFYTGEDEHGVAWNDQDLGIAWPSDDPVLSDRDRSNPPLSKAKELLP